MFNRPTAVSTPTEKTFIPVILTLVDGESLKGAIAIQKNSRLGDLLNGSDRYVLFKTNSGEPIYLSQSTIAAVQSNEKPSARQLDVSMKNLRRNQSLSHFESEAWSQQRRFAQRLSCAGETLSP